MEMQLVPVSGGEWSSEASFDELARTVSHTVAASSARVYDQTYRRWRAWVADNEVDLLDLRPANVTAFLVSQETTKATRQRQLAALRKLAQMAYVLVADESSRRRYEALRLVKAPSRADNVRERARRALTPAQADQLLRAWAEDRPTHCRNRALMAVLLLSGVRRCEAAVLRWSEVDFENGVLTIRHGKGDKQREVPLAGEFALEALRRWHLAQGQAREFVFCPLERGEHVGQDKPITGTDVYRIVKATEALTGVECRPHDARRTLITEALATGTPLATVQAIAGHARGETTLRYAQAVDARRARQELKLRYG